MMTLTIPGTGSKPKGTQLTGWTWGEPQAYYMALRENPGQLGYEVLTTD